MAEIHPTASVSRECELSDGVEIGPGCVLSGRVTLGTGVRLVGNVYLSGPVAVGAGTIIYPFACLGFPGQDVKFKIGDPTPGVRVGRNCIVREHVTVHAATKAERPTLIGDRVFMMVGSHAGHDALVEDDVVMVNHALVAGHGHVGASATMSGGAALHQFCRIGRLAFASGGSALSTDLPPFCVSWGRNSCAGLNVVGLRRSGMPRDQITLLRTAFREALRPPLLKAERLRILERIGRECPAALELADFLRTAKRAFTPMRSTRDWAEGPGGGE